MITFEQIMQTVEQTDIGTIVKNCGPASIAEARKAAKNHPELDVRVSMVSSITAHIAITPKEWKNDNAPIVGHILKGSRAVHNYFKKGKNKLN